MHTDEKKRFDKRNLERNLKTGVIIPKDYETYLSKLPDVSSKVFNPDGLEGAEDLETRKDAEGHPRKKAEKRKTKAKGK